MANGEENNSWDLGSEKVKQSTTQDCKHIVYDAACFYVNHGVFFFFGFFFKKILLTTDFSPIKTKKFVKTTTKLSFVAKTFFAQLYYGRDIHITRFEKKAIAKTR